MTFKRDDIKPCAICGNGVARGMQAVGLFWRLKIERLILDPRGIQQTHGLEQMLGGGQGGAAMARVMGTDPELAKTLEGPHEVLICEPCVMEKVVALFTICESITEKAEAKG